MKWCVTDEVILLKIWKLVVFTYIEPTNMIGFLWHRLDDKQFWGYGWNPHTGAVTTLRNHK